MKRISRRLLSFLLTVTLVLGCAAPVWAKEKAPYEFKSAGLYSHYLSLGDSITAGCGLDGYNRGAENVLMEEAYPFYVMKALGLEHEQYEDGTWQYYQAAHGGWRSDEVRILLEDDYYGDDFTEHFLDQYAPYGIDHVIGLREQYRRLISEADLITIAYGSNDLGGRVKYAAAQAAIEVTKGTPLESAVQKIIDEWDECGDTESMKKLLSLAETADLYLEIVKLVLEKMSDVISRFTTNWDCIIRDLRGYNPTAKLVVLGLYNPGGNLASVAGTALAAPFINSFNEYIRFSSPLSGEYTYTDLTGIDILNNHAEDGLHPNAVTQREIADCVLEAIDSIPVCDHTRTVKLFKFGTSYSLVSFSGDTFCLDCGSLIERGFYTFLDGKTYLPPKDIGVAIVTAVLSLRSRIQSFLPRT